MNSENAKPNWACQLFKLALKQLASLAAMMKNGYGLVVLGQTA
jgi:hypothetical protein